MSAITYRVLPDVVRSDFNPRTQWKKWKSGPRWTNGKLVYIIDRASPRTYLDRCHWNEPLKVIRLKCLALAIATPIVHSVIAVAMVVLRILRSLSFYYFIRAALDDVPDWKEARISCLVDWIRILAAPILTPIVLLGLEGSAVFGLIHPLNGRKLYAAFERLGYNGPILAPCFQFHPHEHFFSGLTKGPNRW